MHRFSIILTLCCILGAIGFASAQGDDELEPTFPDVRYVEDGDFKQKVDIFLPEVKTLDIDEPLPVIFLLHGSGYTKWDMKPLAAHFIAEGYAAVSIEYRDKFPALAGDVFCALAWSFNNAETYGFDPEHFVVLGHSQGGFGAAIVGVTADPADYLTECAHQWPEDYALDGIILYAAGGLQEEVVTNEIDGDEPPFLLIHGEIDRLVSPEDSENFAMDIEAVEGDVSLVLLSEVGHFFTDPESEAGEIAIEYVDDFLVERFKEDTTLEIEATPEN